MEQRKFVLGFYGITTVLFAIFVAVLFLGGTGGDPAAGRPDSSGIRAAEPATSTVPAQASQSSPTLTVRASDYGQILFDGDGRALYAFTSDPRAQSVCADACAEAWPPYLVDGKVRAGQGTEQSLLATNRRTDGGRQVTYAGRPLYYYVGDREPGQVLCQNVVEFGGTWLVVTPSGRLVR
ncbi:MAG: COG4315 family predicted lipoprotein [Gaiellaceae bacterium]